MVLRGNSDKDHKGPPLEGVVAGEVLHHTISPHYHDVPVGRVAPIIEDGEEVVDIITTDPCGVDPLRVDHRTITTPMMTTYRLPEP